MPTPSEIKEAFLKLARYCAYQERCHQEVKEKLRSLGMFGSDAEAIIEALEDENFLNQARFAETFAVSKFRQKHWGRRKISYALKQKGISGTALDTALNAIEEDAYLETLQRLATKKWESLPEDLSYLQKKNKTTQYLLQKGYESQLIQDATP